MNKKNCIVALTMLFLLATNAGAAVVEIGNNPPIKLTEKNTNFSFNVSFDPFGTEITAAQFDMQFNGVLTVQNVSEGDLFNQKGTIPTIFNPGIIENGRLINVWGLIIQPGSKIATKGNMTRITMTATQNGTFALNLTNVIIADPSSNAIGNNITTGYVCVSPNYDINCVDHKVNIVDLTILNQNWGKSGDAMCPQYEKRCDIDKNNIVNIADKLILQQNYNKPIIIG